MSEQRWQWVREQMPVTREFAYMNSGWSGPLSTPVVEAMQRRL
ncbi:MAG: aminotransferase class V-fold PLP-dependent enzyme, partial [Dehalococcoidia bacterium]|nr:aminotransferase class V-fold PLP-dependent enzyme [Dehalococcoidia bacterium]